MEVVHTPALKGVRSKDLLTVGVAQIAPVWSNREATLEKVAGSIETAASHGCKLVTFGEALVPGYPFWIEPADGTPFNDALQEPHYARYLDQGVVIERGDLMDIAALARQHQLAVYLGIMERTHDRGSHSLCCSLVYVDAAGVIHPAHRKLHPTYEVRLAWAQGEGHDPCVHDLGPFRVGGLNGYENWLPLARAALYAQDESLHVSVWPGGLHNTNDLPAFIAKESRSYVIACSGLMRSKDFPKDTPDLDIILSDGASVLSNGGSTIVAPDGAFLTEPILGVEALIVAEIDAGEGRCERQNLNQASHTNWRMR